MTQCLTLRVNGNEVEALSERIWELWPEVEGVQESPDAASGLFAIREDFEILEFGSEAARKAAQWLESDAYRANAVMRLLVYLNDTLAESVIRERVQVLGSDLKIDLEWVSLQIMAERDYMGDYRKSVSGAAIGSNLWVGPPWDQSEERARRDAYIVEPGLAFGTGDHPTTQMMLVRLEERARLGDRPKRVLDLGCGTGVLGLAALRMFAPSQLCFADLDPLCEAEVSKTFDLNSENLGRLGLSLRFGAEGTAEAIAYEGLKFDLVISNIYAEILAAIAPAIHRLLVPNGLWMCSGILAGNCEIILDEAAKGLFHGGERRSQSKKAATLDSQQGMQAVDETWVLREYLAK